VAAIGSFHDSTSLSSTHLLRWHRLCGDTSLGQRHRSAISARRAARASLAQGFFCCCGTGLENFSKLGEGFYFHNGESLWVNLFFASEWNWRETGVLVREETRFPEEPGTRLVFQRKAPTAFDLNVRIPYWANNATITINGKPLQTNEKLKPSTYAKIHRTRENGDRVEGQIFARRFPCDIRPRARRRPQHPGSMGSTAHLSDRRRRSAGRRHAESLLSAVQPAVRGLLALPLYC
jgi:DUF1680 family protein